MFISFLVNCSYMKSVSNREGILGFITLDFYGNNCYDFPGGERFPGFLLCVIVYFVIYMFLSSPKWF